jgi:hypothetical protein
VAVTACVLPTGDIYRDIAQKQTESRYKIFKVSVLCHLYCQGFSHFCFSEPTFCFE